MKVYSKSLTLILSLIIITFSGNAINCLAADTKPQPDAIIQENVNNNNNNTQSAKNDNQQKNNTKLKKNKKKNNSENTTNPVAQNQTSSQNENNLKNTTSDTKNVQNNNSNWSNEESSNPKKQYYQTSSKKNKSKKSDSVGATEPKPFSFSAEDASELNLSASSDSLEQESQSLPQSQDSSQPVENHSIPSDLPEVDSSDIVLPQVTAATPNNSDNLVPGIIAWSFIAIGVAIVIFILFKGSQQNNDISLNNKSNKKKKGKSKLLSDKYYK